MLRGYNRPRKSDIFGPSSTGGRINHAGQRDVYQEGEGIGSFFSSIFRKLIPFVTKTAKTVAGSSLVKGAGQALQDSAVSGLTNVAADLIGGNKNLKERTFKLFAAGKAWQLLSIWGKLPEKVVRQRTQC